MIKVLSDNAKNAVDAEIISDADTPDNLVAAQTEEPGGPTITRFFPAEAVEGLFAMLLAHVKTSLDFVHNGELKLKKLDNIKACFMITVDEVLRTLQFLAPYNDASLNPKHRLCRAMVQEMQRRLITNDIMDAKRMRNKKVVRFGRDVVDFLTAIHTVLHEGTAAKDRYDIKERFCGETINEGRTEAQASV